MTTVENMMKLKGEPAPRHDATDNTQGRDIIFHVGFEKTGTTFLQRGFFRQYESLGKESVIPEAKGISKQLGCYVREMASSVWQQPEAQSLADEMARATDRSPILYSSEHWTCAPFFDAQFPVTPPCKEVHRVTEHLRDFARYAWKDRGRVRAIVTIRRQPEYLASLYAQRSCHFRASQRDFEHRVERLFADGGPHGWRYIDYHCLYQALTHVLGPENVLFLIFEELGSQTFWSTLLSFCDLPPFDETTKWSQENARRISEDTWTLRSRRFITQAKWFPITMRAARRILPRTGKKFVRFSKALENLTSLQGRRTVVLREEMRNVILEKYRESNQSLAKTLQKDLASLGYF